MRTEHLPECDKAWGYADAMCGRGIETADCWLCELLDRTRAEALREAREAVAAMRPETDPDIAHVIVSDVLAAIDALAARQAPEPLGEVT
jgi:hypothetical protein